jgi:hypothetical protein
MCDEVGWSGHWQRCWLDALVIHEVSCAGWVSEWWVMERGAPGGGGQQCVLHVLTLCGRVHTLREIPSAFSAAVSPHHRVSTRPC